MRPGHGPNAEKLLDAGDLVGAGRVYESLGRPREAIDAYLRARAFEEAGRVFARYSKFREAAITLLRCLPQEPTRIRKLSLEARRAASNAAMFFARGGARVEAVGLLMNLGEHQKAASLLQMAGRKREAARAMRGESIEGSPWPAGVLFSLYREDQSATAQGVALSQGAIATVPESEQADPAPDGRSGPRIARGRGSARDRSGPSLDFKPLQPPRGAIQGLQAGPPSPSRSPTPMPAGQKRRPALGGRGLSRRSQAAPSVQFALKAAPEHPAYVEALHRILRAAWQGQEQGRIEARFVEFLSDYIARVEQGVPSPDELGLLYAIARLMEFHDKVLPAKRAYGVVAAVSSSFKDNTERLRNLEADLVETERDGWLPYSFLDESVSVAPLPSLESLVRLRSPKAATPAPRSTGMGESSPRRAGAGGSKVTRIDGDHLDRTSAAEEWACEEDEDGDFDAPSLAAGTVIAGRYEIKGLVGRGGMATVYRAADNELEEEVALKHFEERESKEGLRRFRREMKLSRDLVHPNIVRIYEFGTWEGTRYITMELLDGLDLERHLEDQGGHLPVREVLRLSIQACDGIGHAHKAGVVHRDVKPPNLFIIDSGKTLKVMDFGIAKGGEGNVDISKADVRVGTPRYMSPEQIEGKGDVGPGADLYAFGGVIYEMLTGTTVFEEDDLVRLLFCHLHEEPDWPAMRRPDLDFPGDVEAIVMRLLSKDPGDRFKGCGALKKALLQAYVALERLS